MKIESISVSKLISPEWNPRQITDTEMEKLKTSLTEFGYIEPIIVNDVNMHVVGGNQRLTALKQLGYTEVDCVYVTIKDIEKEKACNIALNKISGEWDIPKLEVVLEDIQLSDIDIELTGFDELELKEFDLESSKAEEDKEEITVTEDDYEIPDDIETNIQHGDLFKLGNHYLLCGDSTLEEDINTLLGGGK